MKRPKHLWLAWIMLCFWASCLVVFQSWVAGQERLARWTPELGLVFLVALAGYRHFGFLVLASYWLALTRIAFSVQPPSAIFAGYLAAALLLRSICTVVEVEGTLARAWIAGLSSWLFLLWLQFVQGWHEGIQALPASMGVAPLPLWSMAASTGVCALLLGPLLRRLPGLSPLVGSGIGGKMKVRFAAPPSAPESFFSGKTRRDQ